MGKAKDNSKKKRLIIIFIIILFIVALAGGFAVYKYMSDKKPETSNGVVGRVSDGWDTGLEDESKPKGKGIQIPGYATAEMNEGDMSLKLSVGNPKDNECGFYASLVLEDGTVLYESELLKPGYGLTELPLSQTLKKGEYTAMVHYKCVTLDEEETPLNSAESEFKLIVK